MEFNNYIKKCALKWNIKLNEEQIKKFKKYKDYLIQKNMYYNLTSITNEKDIITKHFMDSISISLFFNFNTNIDMLDIGSGAGFPSIPLKIINNNIKLTIIDCLMKRVTFLRELVDLLELKNVKIIHGRAETLGQKIELRETFNVVTSRAVAHLSTLSEYCIPFIQKDGLFIPLKSHNYEEELNSSLKAISLLGCELIDTKDYILPFTDIKSNILIFKKTNNTPLKYPRKSNQIKNNPLRKI